MNPSELIHIFIIIFAGIFGLCVGSFLNVVIHRLPLEENIVFPGSHCPQCKKKLRWFHNIPVFSFLALKGKCAFCKAPITWRYPAIELITAIFFVVEVILVPNPVAWPFHLFFLSALLVSTAIDLKYWIIPDLVTLPGIVIGLIGACLIPEESLLANFIGALLGGGILFSIAWIYTFLTKKDGIGGGDIKFLAMIGAFLGAQGALQTLILSSILGSILGIFLIIFKGKGGKTAIPFGPFLSLGAFAAFLFGDTLWKWYFHL